MTVVPLAVAAAMTIFSLAVTLGLVQQHVRALQSIGADVEHPVIVDASAHLLQRQHVSVQAPASDDVAARRRKSQAAGTRRQPAPRAGWRRGSGGRGQGSGRPA